MCPVRDFTSSAKLQLQNTMRDIVEEDNQFWIFSGIVDSISDCFTSNNIAEYEGSIEAYHRAVLDSMNTSAEQLETIWSNVYECDTKYARTFKDLTDQIDTLANTLQSHADALNPVAAAGGRVPLLLRPPEVLSGFLQSYVSPEYNHDHALQKEIQSLFGEARFSSATWNTASADERLIILQEFYDRVQDIMGTGANADIIFVGMGRGGSTITLGSYTHDSRNVELNSDLLADGWRRQQLLETVIHELRHAYQHEAVDDPGRFIVSKETCTVWENNFDNYVRPENDFQAYREQPVEWDAKGFAGENLRGLTASYEGSWEDVPG